MSKPLFLSSQSLSKSKKDKVGKKTATIKAMINIYSKSWDCQNAVRIQSFGIWQMMSEFVPNCYMCDFTNTEVWIYSIKPRRAGMCHTLHVSVGRHYLISDMALNFS